ncbi:hypothetical protein [Vallitalea okinawensis]|uniref:hypothetical protein n=1 Tax=Vallitalea okinawensis TaxID=2078660 RepID=UPI000CFCA34A|nr:hypothetical protein [Vallitalea okinawensis]
MENAIKALIIGSSVIITLVIITFGFLILRQGQDLVKHSSNEISEMSNDLLESKFTIYDGSIISGSTVVNVVRDFKDEYIGVYIDTNKSAGKWYIYDASGDSLTNITWDMNDLIDETDDDYVNPSGNFLGNIKRDSNGVIIGIEFTQQ